MQMLALLCNACMMCVEQATVLMSLLQPPPETYDLFDDIMLLSDGAPFPFCRQQSSKELCASQRHESRPLHFFLKR